MARSDRFEVRGEVYLRPSGDKFQASVLEVARFALTFSLTKIEDDLIRSGLKFNNWLKKVIAGAIGGWCPRRLIAPYLSSVLIKISQCPSLFAVLFLFFFFFPSEDLVHSVGRLGNNLLCIDVQLCHLIYPPPLSSNIASRASLVTTSSSFRSNKSVSFRFFFSRFLSVFLCSYLNSLTMYLLKVIFAVDSFSFFFFFWSMEKIIAGDSLQFSKLEIRMRHR